MEVWQSSTSPKNIKFPPEDLTPKLFDFFFRSVTPFLPVIHRPSFEAQFADGVHFRCPAFACVVLLVCAIGSKYSDDPRVSLEEAGPASAGWKYFIQVKELKKALYAPATLADLQCFVVSLALLSQQMLQPKYSGVAGGLLSPINKRSALRVDYSGHWDPLCPRCRRTSQEGV